VLDGACDVIKARPNEVAELLSEVATAGGAVKKAGPSSGQVCERWAPMGDSAATCRHGCRIR
jgi:hypothetical protein